MVTDSYPTRMVVGTRGSALAVRQTGLIVNLLRARFPAVEWSVETLKTRGDEVRDRPISELGDKGVFVRAIEIALLEKRIDIAVHSLKDMPADIETAGLCLSAFSAREDPRDALVSGDGTTLAQLPPGARIGTSSLRRRVQLMKIRPDLALIDIRGNVDTRLRKLDAGEYEAVMLAAAGLRRLDLGKRITEYLPVESFVPDAGQGILAVQTREHDSAAEMARAIDDPEGRRAAVAERAVVRGLNAGCHSPVGAYARRDGDVLRLRAMAATEDGARLVTKEVEGRLEQGAEMGHRLGLELLAALG